MMLSNEDVFSFDELFDITELQKMQDLFSELTGLASVITLKDGTPVTKPSNFCCLCNIIRSTDKGLINCRQSDSHLLQMSKNSAIGHMQPCLSLGLWDSAVNIVVDGKHVGNLIVGQIKNEELDFNNILDYSDSIGADKDEIIAAYGKVTVMSTEKLHTATLFLNLLVTEFAEKISYKKRLKFDSEILRRKEMEDLLKSSELKFRSYLEFSPHGIVISDEDGKLVEVNTAITRITGYNSDELLTTDKCELFAPNNEGRCKKHNQKARKYGMASDELELKTKSGEIKYVQVDTIKMPNRKYIGFVSDVTYRRKIEDNLRQKQQYLEEIQKIARIGNASIDFEKGTWESSKVLNDIVGIDKHYGKSIESWIQIIHPEMLPKLKDYFLNDIVPNKLALETEIKIIRQNDGQIRWLYVVGQPEFNDTGTIKKLLFTLQDVTERKEWTDILYQNEALYRSILNTSPDIIVVVDLDGKVKMLSPIAKQLYGSDDVNSIIGRSIFEFVDKTDHARMLSNFKKMFDGYLGTIEYKMIRANAEVFPADVNGDVIRNNNDEPTGLIFIVRDITERKQVEENLASSKEQLREFAGHLQSIREEEKIALAREIHDDLGQILVAMKIEIGMFKKQVNNSNHPVSATLVEEEMTKLSELTNKTIAITRRIMSDLRSENVNNLGFVEAAKMYIDNFYERFKIECKFENNVGEIEFSQKQTVALYRILQESLNNIVKHANASFVFIRLNQTLDMLCLHIEDTHQVSQLDF